MQADKVNLTIQQYGATVLQPGVNAMLGQDNYLLFSNHSTDPAKDGTPTTGDDYGLYASLEVSLNISIMISWKMGIVSDINK